MLPNAIRPLSLNALDGPHYETSRQIIDAHNQLLKSLAPGPVISPSSFGLSNGLGQNANIGATSGALTRGKFTLTIGSSGVTVNPTFTINIPKGTFSGAPIAQVTQSGGTGTLPISYVESTGAVTVTLIGTPTASDTYIFNFGMGD